jgi:hypothetical protein
VPNVQYACKSVWAHPVDVVSDVGKLVSVYLEIVLISAQDRCMVRVKRAKGQKIILDAPNGTPMWCGSSESSFRST